MISCLNRAVFYTALLLLPITADSQVLNINLGANRDTVCTGDTVVLTASGSFMNTIVCNFNNNVLPNGWTSGGSLVFTSPCQPSPDGTPYYWASTSTGTPYIQTADLNMTSGGSLIFEFIYSVQAGPSPCEGPDEMDEGISVQYSTDAGNNWIDLIYYSPGGYTLPTNPGGNTTIATGPTAYTVWNRDTVPLPPAACTGSTRFRWIQFMSSGTCCDNWGLDNIMIGTTSPLHFDWTPGPQGLYLSSLTVPNMISSQWYSVTVTDTATGLTGSDSIYLVALAPPVAHLLYDSVICAGDDWSVDASLSTPVGAISEFRYDMDNNGTYEYTNGSDPTFDLTFSSIPGMYTFGAELVNAGGCSTAVNNLPVAVHAVPWVIAELFSSPTCTGDSVQFFGNATLNLPPAPTSSISLYLWDFDNNGITDASGTELDTAVNIYTTPGTYYAMVTVQTTGGCSFTDSIMVNICDDTGLDPADGPMIYFYPNPASHSVNISGSYFPGEIIVTDMTGKVLIREVFAGSSHALNLEELAPGVYILRIGQYSRKLIKA